MYFPTENIIWKIFRQNVFTKCRPYRGLYQQTTGLSPDNMCNS